MASDFHDVMPHLWLTQKWQHSIQNLMVAHSRLDVGKRLIRSYHSHNQAFNSEMARFLETPQTHRGECVTPIISETMYPWMRDHRRSPPDIPQIRDEISCVREYHINVTRAKCRAQTRKLYNKRVHSRSNTSWLTLVGHHMTYSLWDSLSDSSYALSIVEISSMIENGHQCEMEDLKLEWISSFPYLLNVTGLGLTALQSEFQCWLLFPSQVGTLLAAMIVNWDGCNTSFWSEELSTVTTIHTPSIFF